VPGRPTVTDDSTLGGYLAVHSRAPAFSGKDGRAYSVDVFVDPAPDARGRYGAALFFVRWSEGGERPDGHVETGYVAHGASPAQALDAARRLTLHQVKRLLDEAIAADSRPAAW
jgi:hypothetical protein